MTNEQRKGAVAFSPPETGIQLRLMAQPEPMAVVDDNNAYGEALYRRWLRGEKNWMDFHSGEDWVAFSRAHHEHSVNRTSTDDPGALRPERAEDGSGEETGNDTQAG